MEPATRKALRARYWLLGVLATQLVALELQASWLQSRVFHWMASRATYTVRPAPVTPLELRRFGPYDERLGYARTREFIQRLEAAGFVVDSGAQPSALLSGLARLGITPPYAEKDRAGLRILGDQGTRLYEFSAPRRAYRSFEEIPPVIVRTLLFIENREALHASTPYRNPVVEWDRLGKAVLDLTLSTFYPRHPVSGGSTLAVQVEKLRHSPGARTVGAGEKARQMLSASLRVYQRDLDTREERREIVRAYLNSLPLASVQGWGEVQGLADGLEAWFGADPERVNELLWRLEERQAETDPATRQQQARAFQQVLLLLLAAKKPSYFLGDGWPDLERRFRQYLGLLEREGIVPRDIAQEAGRSLSRPQPRPLQLPARSWAERKGVDAVRIELMRLLGVAGLYDVDRLDLEVTSTLNGLAQRQAAEFLMRLADPEFAAQHGLFGHRLLQPGQDPSRVVFSFVLYEATPQGNVLRVQVDNLQQPLNFNEHTKLELGSTAKLRTLAMYLEVVGELHQTYARKSPQELETALQQARDPITEWALRYLLQYPEATLPEMLEAALERQYSASPYETFFTAGGAHRFANFEPEDNHRILTVREAFHRSVNLVFIRLMRDLVEYHIVRLPGYTPEIFTDPSNPLRQQYLDRFIEWESKVFLTQFYQKYEGMGIEEALYRRAREMDRPTPKRLAALYRWVRPEVGIDGFAAFLMSVTLNPNLSNDLIEELYRAYGPGRYSLEDQAYLAGVHPLELWMLRYKAEHPKATLSEILSASGEARRSSYRWLLRPTRKAAQDRGIRIILEQDAFVHIHRRWKRLGYPFDRLVPSFATAIGTSGDTPAALAELVGIILNHGIRKPTYRVGKIDFASATPFETHLRWCADKQERVMLPEIAEQLRKELEGVVKFGTARRVANGVVLPSGEVLPVGGKTGTGDNRYEVFGRGGEVIRSMVRNRTATFAFFIGDRWFGTISAFVPEEAASGFDFTSSLAVQVFKELAPAVVQELKGS